MKRVSRNDIRRKRPATQRRGYTLIEVTLYISLIAAMGASYVTVLRAGYRAEQDAARMRNEGAQLHRFRLDWTRDVHAARAATVSATDTNAPKLVLTFEEMIVVEYFQDRDHIRRWQWSGEVLIRQEAYLLAEDFELEWQVDEALRVAEAKVWRGASDKSSRALWRHLIARVASDARFSGEVP